MNLSKPAKWFRMYAEFLNDHKVQILYENLVTACFNCNRSKRDKLVSEWRAD